MSNTNKVNVELVNINSKQVETSAKTLKQRIKELRLELENLDESSDLYQQKITELGNALHLNAEIQEQAKLASTDYGDTLAAVTKATGGLVAGVSSVNAVMTLVGGTTSEAQEAMVRIQALMAIVQGLQSFDDSEKAFQSLWTKIKNVTVARQQEQQQTQKETIETNKNTVANTANAQSFDKQKMSIKGATTATGLFKNGISSLWKALKSFALSNPFTLIITALSGAIALVSTFISKAKEARKEARQAIIENIQQLVDSDSDDMQTTTFMYKQNSQAYQKELDNMKNKMESFENWYDNLTKRQIDNEREKLNIREKQINKLQEELDTEQQRLDIYTAEQKQVEPYLSRYQEYLKERIKLYKQRYDLIIETGKAYKTELNLYKKDSDDYNDTLEKIKDTKTELNKVQENIKNTYLKIDEFDKQREANKDKDRENSKVQIEKYYQFELDKLKDKLAKEQALNKLQYDRLIIDEENYLKREYDLLKRYNDNVNDLYGKNPNVSELDKINATQAMVTAEKRYKEFQLALIQNKTFRDEYIDDAVADEKRMLKDEIESLGFLTQLYLEQTKKLSEKFGVERYNYMVQQHADEAKMEELLYQKKLVRLKQQYKDEQDALETRKLSDVIGANLNHSRDMEALQFQLDEKLIMQKDYDLKLEELTLQHNKRMEDIEKQYSVDLLNIQLKQKENEQQMAMERLQIVENEVNRKIEMQESYVTAYNTIVSQISGLLNEIGSQYDENSKQYKNIQRFNIISDTISGSMSAFVSGVKSGLLPPWNMIYGGTLAGLVTATGIAQLHNLNNNTISTTSAVNNVSNNSNPYETLAYNTLSNIEGNIMDSKVYIVESERQAVQNRMEVYINESTF